MTRGGAADARTGNARISAAANVRMRGIHERWDMISLQWAGEAPGRRRRLPEFNHCRFFVFSVNQGEYFGRASSKCGGLKRRAAGRPEANAHLARASTKSNETRGPPGMETHEGRRRAAGRDVVQ